MTSDIGKCPSCGAEVPSDAPNGFCPGCLYRLGFRESAGGNVSDASAAEPETFPSPDVQDLPPNPSFGDYDLLERVGHGGMGVVYKACQKSLNRMVALKLLPLGPHASPDSIKRFRAEAVSTAALQHPNIVAIHEVGFCHGQHFISMEYVEGRPLSELIRGTPLPPRRAARYLKIMAEAIHYAHERGILHRDLKPANVLIDPNDQPRVTDFGLAKRLDDSQLSTLNPQLTLTGQLLGSPNYMPPEQAVGTRGTLSRRTDVYALGAILYHALTGRPPYLGEGLADIVQQVLLTDPVAPRLLNATLPRDLETICLKCLEKEPAKRYPTAQALAEELGRFLEGQPILARPLGAAGKTWRWCRRNPRLAGALGLALVSIALGFTGVSWQWRRAEAQRQRAESGESLARRNAYAADMKEVQRTLEENDLGRALEILNRHRPVGRFEADLRGWEWRYFWGRCQSDPHTLLCRASNSVSALAFSADGKWLAVRRSDGAVSLWDALTRAPTFELPGRAASGCKALALSPRGTLLAYGSTDATGKPAVRLWDWSAWKEIASLPHPDSVMALAFSPQAATLASLGHDGMVRVWDLGSNQILSSFPTRRNDVYLDFAGPAARATNSVPKGNEASEPALPQPRSRYGTTSIWADHYGTLLFSADGRFLAVGEAAPRVRLRDQITGKETIIEVPAPADGITALAFSPDSRLLAAGCGVADNDVHLWDLATGTKTSLEGHKGWIAGLAFSPDGRQLVSVGADQSIRLWELDRRREQKRFRSNTDEVWAVAWSSDGQYFTTGAKDGSVCLWDPGSEVNRLAHAVLPTQCYFWEPAFLPDSRSFLTALRSDGSVVRWNATTLREIETLPWLGTNHTCLAFSSDGRWLALGDLAGNVQVWDYQARLCVTNLVIPQAGVFAVFFSARDRFLGCGAFAAGRASVGKIWATGGWRELSLEGIDLKNCVEAVFSPDERCLAVGYWDREAAWWELATNTRRLTLAAQGGSSPAVAFSPDGTRFAAADRHGSMTVLDRPTGRSESIARGYGNVLNDVIFSPDGGRLVAIGTSPKGMLKLWDIETRRELVALPTPLEWFCHLGFSPDGDTLFATSTEGSALFWHAPSFAEIEALERSQR